MSMPLAVRIGHASVHVRSIKAVYHSLAQFGDILARDCCSKKEAWIKWKLCFYSFYCVVERAMQASVRLLSLHGESRQSCKKHLFPRVIPNSIGGLLKHTVNGVP